MPEKTANPIPTQLNIAPRGKTWKNWQLVDGEDGFPTRETMEKYLCNPARVRELEECRALNLETIERLNKLLDASKCQGCAVQQGTHVPMGAVVQIQEPNPAPKNGYYDGDDDDEDGTPLFQSAEEVIRRSAEVRELRAGEVICIVQLVNDEHASQQHARLTEVDDPDAETELAWVFISNQEAKAYYEDKQAQKRTALHPKRVENVIFRMEMEGDAQAAETVQAQRELIATLQSQLEAIGAGGVEPLRKPVQATDAEPFGYVNTHTGQFFKDVELCRKNNEGHWRTVYSHPTQQGLEQPWLQERHLTALKRFQETTDDSQPYDISNNFIKHLLAIGCLQNHGFGKYSITEFGNYVLNSWDGARELPFKSQIERDGEGHAAQAKQGGV